MNLKPKKGTILDESGNAVSGSPDSTEATLEHAIQALVEARVNTALDQLRVTNEQELNNLVTAYKKKWAWRWVAIAFTATSFLWGIVTWFVAPEKIKFWIAEYVKENVAAPALKDAVSTTAQKEASRYVDIKLLPLEERAKALETQIDSIKSDVTAKQSTLSAEQAKIRELVRIQELPVSAKMGDQSAYNELSVISNGKVPNSALARLFLSDVSQFYEADRNQLFFMTFQDTKTEQSSSLSIEEAIQKLSSQDEKDREAAANVLCDLGCKTAVAALEATLVNETDLRVIGRITRALNKLTEQRFEPLEKDRALKWWNDNSKLAQYNFLYDDYLTGAKLYRVISPIPETEFATEISKDSALRCIVPLRNVLEREPKATKARFHLVAALLSLGKLEEAEKEFQSLRAHQADSQWVSIASALLNMTKNTPEAAVTDLNSLFERLPGSATMVRRFSAFKVLAKNEKMKWPPTP